VRLSAIASEEKRIATWIPARMQTPCGSLERDAAFVAVGLEVSDVEIFGELWICLVHQDMAMQVVNVVFNGCGRLRK
jgi:hypothetical protein